TTSKRDWSSDVCSSDLYIYALLYSKLQRFLHFFCIDMPSCTVNFNKHGLPRQRGRPNLFISFNSGPVGSVHCISGTGFVPDHLHRRLTLPQALFTEPKSSIFSFTVALIASKPGARSLRGS